MKIGDWTIVNTFYALSNSNDGKNVLWGECICKCGRMFKKIISQLKSYIKKGRNTKCRECYRADLTEDITGKTFGSRVVIKCFYSRRKNDYRRFATCLCKCGKIDDVKTGMLLSGKSTKCSDCQSIENLKKGTYDPNI